MVDAWPVDLPQCFSLPFSESEGDGVFEYQPDQGPPISRRRTSAVTRPLSGTMRMSGDQLASMRAFRNGVLLSGALPFEFPDQTVHGNTLLVRFVKGSPPSWQRIGPDSWRVSISLMVMP